MDNQLQSQAANDERVSTLVGDRLCARCCYNLTGQAILRERHYQMLIIRCPECGTVASVQEYPLLGRWANRWAAFLAGVWVLVLVGLTIGTGAAIFGFSIGIAEEAASPFRNHIFDRYAEWSQTAGIGSDWKEWSDQQDMAALFAEAGGWRSGVQWMAIWLAVPYVIVVFGLGCFWGVALIGSGWRARLVLAMLVMTVAIMFSSFAFVDWHSSGYQGFARQIGQPFLIASLSFGAITLACGLTSGRPIVRILLRTLLPPRLCQSLAMLWTADGLAPPRSR